MPRRQQVVHREHLIHPVKGHARLAASGYARLKENIAARKAVNPTGQRSAAEQAYIPPVCKWNTYMIFTDAPVAILCFRKW